MENQAKYEVNKLVDELVEHIEDRNDAAEAEIEKADLVEEVAERLLSDLGKFNLAVHLLRRCGRSDLATQVEAENKPAFGR